jgi:hypothetical protein
VAKVSGLLLQFTALENVHLDIDKKSQDTEIRVFLETKMIK